MGYSYEMISISIRPLYHQDTGTTSSYVLQEYILQLKYSVKLLKRFTFR